MEKRYLFYTMNLKINHTAYDEIIDNIKGFKIILPLRLLVALNQFFEVPFMLS